ncbi:MAG: IS4 family transposase, partial [Candidatus Saccharimonadales bacterium]
AWTALVMAWDDGATMQARFQHATQVGHELHPHWRLGESYGGFTAALADRSSTVVPGIARRFRQRMRALAGPRWRVRGWCAFAADGTRIETPHTAANEAELGCAGREKSAPQVFLTSLWHMGLGLPWDFRTGPGTDSERRHLEDMLDDLPAGSLIVADAGFCGYRLCHNILKRGHSFLLRVGSNVTLLSELGYHVEQQGDLVYLWPEEFRDQPPLTLRLITLKRGTQTSYLLTDVLAAAELSAEDAAALYEMRWGVEVGYRSYKQTLDRRTMKSRTPRMCLLESQWTMLGLWLLGLLCVSRQLASRHNPRRWSKAAARDAVRCAVRRPDRVCRLGFLAARLRDAVHDSYARQHVKDARNYPRKKREKPPGPPKIKPATPHQI